MSQDEQKEQYCCDMRRYFLFAIIGERRGEDAPVEMADFVAVWEPTIVIRMKFCPFCGVKLPPNDTLRITKA